MANRTSTRRKRRFALARGARGEWLAALFLRLKGYSIEDRNFRCKSGEIDIVARKGNQIIFVEVKARPSEQEALDSVSFQAQRRIANAANVWISRRRDYDRLSWQFDVIAIVPGRWPRHFQQAF
ncbi:MAG: YraN family protein [Pseudomonadota bacterium]